MYPGEIKNRSCKTIPGGIMANYPVKLSTQIINICFPVGSLNLTEKPLPGWWPRSLGQRFDFRVCCIVYGPDCAYIELWAE